MKDTEMYTSDAIRSVSKTIKKVNSNLLRVENMIPSKEKDIMVKKIYEDICEAKKELESLVKEV